ncbi:MAG: CsgG/HfaB family protein [Syntrophobacteria bacterium]
MYVEKMRFPGIFALVLVLLMGCAPKVKTGVPEPAKIDLSPYRKVSVVDFQGDVDDWGTRVALVLAEELGRAKVSGKPCFTVLSRSKLVAALRDQGLHLPDLLEPENCREVGKLLGLDAIFTGTVETARTQEFILPGRMLYAMRTAQVEFTVRVISTHTGEVVFSETRTGEKKQEAFGAVELTELTYHDEPLTSCVRETIQEFTRTLLPA